MKTYKEFMGEAFGFRTKKKKPKVMNIPGKTFDRILGKPDRKPKVPEPPKAKEKQQKPMQKSKYKKWVKDNAEDFARDFDEREFEDVIWDAVEGLLFNPVDGIPIMLMKQKEGARTKAQVIDAVIGDIQVEYEKFRKKMKK